MLDLPIDQPTVKVMAVVEKKNVSFSKDDGPTQSPMI